MFGRFRASERQRTACGRFDEVRASEQSASKNNCSVLKVDYFGEPADGLNNFWPFI
jgi:hypothetical protein